MLVGLSTSQTLYFAVKLTIQNLFQLDQTSNYFKVEALKKDKEDYISDNIALQFQLPSHSYVGVAIKRYSHIFYIPQLLEFINGNFAIISSAIIFTIY